MLTIYTQHLYDLLVEWCNLYMYKGLDSEHEETTSYPSDDYEPSPSDIISGAQAFSN